MAFNIDIRHWHSTLAFDIGIQHWHSTLAFNIGIQRWHSTLTFNVGIQHRHSTSVFNIGIQHWHSTLAFDIGIRHWHSTLAFNIGIQQSWSVHRSTEHEQSRTRTRRTEPNRAEHFVSSTPNNRTTEQRRTAEQSYPNSEHSYRTLLGTTN